MNYRTTIVLVLLLLIVGAYIVFVEWGDPIDDRPEETGGPGEPVFTADEFPTENVEAIELKTPQGRTLKLQKQDGQWLQTEPVRFQLSSWDMRDLIDKAATLRWTARLKPGGGDLPDLKTADLDPPQATLVIHAKARSDAAAEGDAEAGEAEGKEITHTLHLGRMGTGGEWGYVRVNEDERVYIVGGELHKAVLEQGIKQWRDTRVQAPDEGRARRVTLKQDDEAVTVVKAEASSDWSFDEPHSGRVQKQSVSTLLSGVSGINISKFHSDDPADLARYGLEEPGTVLKVTAAGDPASANAADAGEQTYTLRIGLPTNLNRDHYFATWSVGDEPSPVVFQISKQDAEKFTKSPDDLRDPRITTVNAAEARKLNVQRGEQPPIVLEYAPAGWTFGDPAPPYPADAAEARKLVSAVTSARANAFIPDVQPQGDPVATITLNAAARPEADTIKLWPAPDDAPPPRNKAGDAQGDGKRYLAVRNNESTGYLVPADAIAGAFDPLRSLRSRVAMTLDPQKLTQVKITRPDGHAYSFTRPAPAPPQDANNADAAEPASDDDKADEPKATAQNGDAAAAEDEQAPPAPAPTVPASRAWTLAGQERFEAQAFNLLLGELSELRVEQWLADDQKPGDSGIYTIQIERAEGSPVSITIDPQTRHASASNVDMPFQVTQPLLDALSQEFRYSTVLEVKPGDVKQVKIAEGDTELTVQRGDDGTFSTEADVQLDEQAVGGLFDALTGLRAEKFRALEKVKLDAANPVRTLTVTAGDATHVLALWPVNQNDFSEPMARLGESDQLIVLTPQTFERLTADVRQKADENGNARN